ncbi:hypothetical protein [Streptodolium elevatio]|uniref:Uncharacterized protein n=1 Tax=Streptodolium elevatio TaxID=3157996 RepID=A0ABV3DGV3_9ACTN
MDAFGGAVLAARVYGVYAWLRRRRADRRAVRIEAAGRAGYVGDAVRAAEGGGRLWVEERFADGHRVRLVVQTADTGRAR